MKRSEILEIIVSNPQAIFVNGNMVAGKYSEYPAQYQVVGMTNDKSYVRVKRVGVTVYDYLLNEEGNYAKDDEGKWIPDTRPVAERARLTYGEVQSMPTRLVLKSDRTEQGILDETIAKTEQGIRERAERIERDNRNSENLEELKTVLVAVGLLDEEEAERSVRWGRAEVTLYDDKIALLTSLLKSALVEVGV